MLTVDQDFLIKASVAFTDLVAGNVHGFQMSKNVAHIFCRESTHQHSGPKHKHTLYLPALYAATRACAPLPLPAISRLGLCTVSLHLGMWRSAVSSANRRPQCGHGTKSCMPTYPSLEEQSTQKHVPPPDMPVTALSNSHSILEGNALLRRLPLDDIQWFEIPTWSSMTAPGKLATACPS